MNLNKVERIQLDMSPDEAYSLWCLLDEIHDANEVALPTSIMHLTAQLRDMMDSRNHEQRETFKDSRERTMREAGKKQDMGVAPNPRIIPEPRGAMTGR